MYVLVLKFVTPNLNYGRLKKDLKFGEKSVYYVKIDQSQNQDLSTSLERSYKELLNALISFEIRHS